MGTVLMSQKGFRAQGSCDPFLPAAWPSSGKSL